MSTTNQTLTLIVRDAPGVLVRIAHVFARRSFNITSIVVKPQEGGVWSTMTIVVRSAAHPDQLARQLEKLVDVKSVSIS